MRHLFPELLKYQWDECHKWHLGVNWFEDGKEAESSNLILSCGCSNKRDADCSFVKDINSIKEAYSNEKSITLYKPSSGQLNDNFNISGTCFDKLSLAMAFIKDNSVNFIPRYYGIENVYSNNDIKYKALCIYKDEQHSETILQLKMPASATDAAKKLEILKKYIFGSVKKKDIVTTDLLVKIFGGGKNGDFIEQCQPYFNQYMAKFNINTPLRIAHFLAQVGIETNYFDNNSLQEDLNYSSCKIKYNFCKKCYLINKNDPQKCPEVMKCDCIPVYSKSKYNKYRADMCEHPEHYSRQSEKIAMAAYGGYIGRGFIQITSEATYRKNYSYLLSHKCFPENFIAQPEKLSDDLETAVMSACAYFEMTGCNQQADNDNFDGIMKQVNKSDSNRNKKEQLLNKIKLIMNIK